MCAVEVPLSTLRESIGAGLQPAVTKRIGAAVRRKASQTLRRSWQARLQLEVAKHNVSAARKVALDHSATVGLQLAGGC